MRAWVLLFALLGTAHASPDTEAMRAQEEGIADRLDRLDREIADLVVKEARSRLRTEALTGDLDGLSTQVQTQQTKIELARGRLRHRLRGRRLLDNTGYTRVLLNATSLAGLIRRRYELRHLLTVDTQLLSSLQADEALLKALLDRRHQTVGALAENETLLNAQRARLERQRQAQTDLLHTIRTERRLLEATLTMRENQHDRLDTPTPDILVDAGFEGERGRLIQPSPGPVLVPFGPHTDPELGTDTISKGWSIGAVLGAPARAVFGGEVVYSGWYKGFGNLVIIDHGAGWYTLYAHLRALSTARGEGIQQGAIVGDVGDSGSLRGAQLYFEIRQGRRSVDPAKWIRTKQ